MVNTQYLEEKIQKSGLKKQYLADKIGCSRSYLTAKINGGVEFNSKEVWILCEELNIKSLKEKESIFFAY